ncbi:MAG: lytic transglycosylase domain-containing protein [Chromatiaceae bacterium]|jgi:soluble lytic murein transglycosylase-like protein
MPIVIKTIFAFLAWAMAFSSIALADVYKYRDARGHIHLTDKPMNGMRLLKRYQIATGRSTRSPVTAGSAMRQMLKRRDELQPLIRDAAAESQLRPALIHAVVRAESAYRTDAVSSKGAVGLMQLMPATAERYGVDDRRDPVQNLRGGTQYLRDLLVMFDNDLQLALAAYNAGENAVIRYGRKIPPFQETQGYVRKVIQFYHAAGGDKLAAR